MDLESAINQFVRSFVRWSLEKKLPCDVVSAESLLSLKNRLDKYFTDRIGVHVLVELFTSYK